MDIFETIESRTVVKTYDKKDVPEELLAHIIMGGTYACSAGDIQPWEFIIVKDKKMKKEISAAALKQKHIEDAPVLIVVCANIDRASTKFGDRGKDLYCIQDTAACIQNMLLIAHALELGASWIHAFEEEKIKTLLDIPPSLRPVGIITVGFPYPSETHHKPNIIPLENVTWEELCRREWAWFKKYGKQSRFQFKSLYEYAKDAEKKVKDKLEDKPVEEKPQKKELSPEQISHKVVKFIKNLAK